MPDQQITQADLDMAIRKGVDNLKDHIAGFEVGQDELHKRVKAIEMATEGAVPDDKDEDRALSPAAALLRSSRTAVTDDLASQLRTAGSLIEGLTERIAKVEGLAEQIDRLENGKVATVMERAAQLGEIIENQRRSINDDLVGRTDAIRVDMVRITDDLAERIAKVKTSVVQIVKLSKNLSDGVVAELCTRMGEIEDCGEDKPDPPIDEHSNASILDQMDQRLGSLHARVQDVYTKVEQLLLSTDSKFVVMYRDHENHEKMSKERHEETLELISREMLALNLKVDGLPDIINPYRRNRR